MAHHCLGYIVKIKCKQAITIMDNGLSLLSEYCLPEVGFLPHNIMDNLHLIVIPCRKLFTGSANTYAFNTRNEENTH